MSAPLHPWQCEALASWAASGHRGRIEAVTGAGKTRVGLEAIRDRLVAGGRALVLVPGRELLYQWRAAIGAALPEARIGLRGDGRDDDPAFHEVIVSIVDSARRARVRPDVRPGLLVADECHRYGSSTNRLALGAEFEWRLGLSATHHRDDAGDTEVLAPYFGGLVFRLDYARATAEGVIAPFRVALMPVSFEAGERLHYDTLTDRLRNLRRALVAIHGAREAPFAEFMRSLDRMIKGDNRAAGLAARGYLATFNRRRELLAETRAKIDALIMLEDSIRGSSRTLVFTQTVRAAERAAAELIDLGLDASAFHGGLARAERDDLLSRFRAGAVHTLVAPKVLDEGVDVPDADLGIILAASRQRRQMVQRMGRIIRYKRHDAARGAHARFVVLYVEQTSEDPEHGAHETFLGEITETAQAVQHFPLGASGPEIGRFLGAPHAGGGDTFTDGSALALAGT